MPELLPELNNNLPNPSNLLLPGSYLGELVDFTPLEITSFSHNGDGVALGSLEISSAVTSDEQVPSVYDQSGGKTEIYGVCESEINNDCY